MGFIARGRRSLRHLAEVVAGEAYRRQSESDLEGAVQLYERSVRIYPTAEARTYLGWALSLQGNLTGAIRECERAIVLDPSFGNPYNDIGAYLIQLGKWDEAVPWLERAIESERYEARHYPCMNLGRFYQRRMDWARAKQAYMQALSLSPDYMPALLSLRRMLSRFN